MRFLRTALTVALWVLVLAPAGAQVTVSLRLHQENLLLYEPIRATVGVRCVAAHPVALTGSGESSWLTFLVTDDSNRTVGALGGDVPEVSVRVSPGEAVSRTLDLLPRYDIRSPGSYRIRAVVNVGGRQILSPASTITVLQGPELWSGTAALPATEDHGEEARVYSLVSKRERSHEILYIGVRDPAHDLIYGMLRVGPYVPMNHPSAVVDRDGRLHVLFRHQPSAFAYLCVDPQAQVLKTAVYSDLMSRPELEISDEGEVSVRGGLLLKPGQRPPGAADLLPPPRPPPPKPPWWQFWKRAPEAPSP